jgi:AcrR family transcriptional regulator
MDRSRPRKTNKFSARERILRTAHDLFYRDGVRATGIDKIIAESAVAKATFFRHFPSKTVLVVAFLEHRHARWMAWFSAALERHGSGPGALVRAMSEWFARPDFRGCAFLNSVGELGRDIPDVRAIARAHKADVAKAIEALLPPSPARARQALMLCVAMDGAIVRAMFDATPKTALQALGDVVRSVPDVRMSGKRQLPGT